MGKREAEKEGGRKRRKRGEAKRRLLDEESRQGRQKINKKIKTRGKSTKKGQLVVIELMPSSMLQTPPTIPRMTAVENPQILMPEPPTQFQGAMAPPIAAPFPAKNTVPPSDEDAESCR